MLKPPHRPFFVLRHAITGETKAVSGPNCEDGMWQVILTDGSGDSDVEYQQAPAKKRRRKKPQR